MKLSINKLLATAVIASQFIAGSAFANEPGQLERLAEKVKDKIAHSSLSASAGLDILNFNIGDNFSINSGIEYRYNLENDLGKYLREDKWSDNVRAGFELGLSATREYRREFSYGRFYEGNEWGTALKSFLFSPLDLRDLNSDKLSSLIDQGKVKSGDALAVTLNKVTFLGLGASSDYNGVVLSGAVGKAFTGKVTMKMWVKKDKKVTVTFADVDENSIQAGGNVKIGLGVLGLSLKVLSIDANFHIRGTAALETYTYDLKNPAAKAALNKILGAIDSPSILLDKNSLNQLITLDTRISKGLIDMTASQVGSADTTSGIMKEQELTDNIVAGRNSRVKFNLIPGFLQSKDVNTQEVNLLDIKLSGSFIKPGQYIVGYRSKEATSSIFTKNNKITTITSFVYKPEPTLQNPNTANGYRGLNDLVGISFHTDAQQTQNVKETVTYAKFCNAGLVSCPKPISLRVVDPGSTDASAAQGRSSVNSNYLFSKGIFQEIKSRMNWANLSGDNQKKDAIKERLAPVISEVVLFDPELRDKPQKDATRDMTDFFFQILENDCYSNLSGMDASVQGQGFFSRIFNRKCSTNLYGISDDLIRLNMPTLLISLFDPNLLPPLNQPLRKASDSQIKDLAKYFSFSYSSRIKNAQDQDLTMTGAYGLSLLENDNDASQISEFTSLISVWQHQENMDLDHFDRLKMISNK